jgi:hypothetical protein
VVEILAGGFIVEVDFGQSRRGAVEFLQE